MTAKEPGIYFLKTKHTITPQKLNLLVVLLLVWVAQSEIHYLVFVFQAMRLTGAADVLEPISEKLLPKKLPQKNHSNKQQMVILHGNQIGFGNDARFWKFMTAQSKTMEVGFVAGAVPKSWVRRRKTSCWRCGNCLEEQQEEMELAGATGSSKEQDETSIHTMSSEVQKGNAVEERKIQRLLKSK